ncbi:MAG TPA: hypothetical protein VIF62_22130 [Labilithrix sp.]|jgi:hypothetical protein
MKKQVLTEYSGFANTIADTFRAAFKTMKVGDHAVEMTAPEGSTHGGLLALQHVTLKPPSGMALVVGTVNAGEKRSELRSFAHLSRVHDERFKAALPFDEASYKDMLEKAESVLGAFGMEVVVTEAPAVVAAPIANDAPAEEPAQPSRTLLYGGVALAVVVVLALAWAVVNSLR